MRISNALIEEITAEVAGDDVIQLVNVLKDKKNVSEFKLAEAIKIEVNKVRNMLYRLHDANLVSFVRKKDKKKGWYIYYWTFNIPRVKELAFSIKTKRLEKLNERLLKEKGNQFYTCVTNRCIRLDFDQAMNFEFKCPECGNLIDQENNDEYVRKIENEIKTIHEELKESVQSKPKEPKSPVSKPLPKKKVFHKPAKHAKQHGKKFFKTKNKKKSK